MRTLLSLPAPSLSTSRPRTRRRTSSSLWRRLNKKTIPICKFQTKITDIHITRDLFFYSNKAINEFPQNKHKQPVVTPIVITRGSVSHGECDCRMLEQRIKTLIDSNDSNPFSGEMSWGAIGCAGKFKHLKFIPSL